MFGNNSLSYSFVTVTVNDISNLISITLLIFRFNKRNLMLSINVDMLIR